MAIVLQIHVKNNASQSLIHVLKLLCNQIYDLILGNLWRELWETSKPVPAVRQSPLYDEDLAV